MHFFQVTVLVSAFTICFLIGIAQSKRDVQDLSSAVGTGLEMVSSATMLSSDVDQDLESSTTKRKRKIKVTTTTVMSTTGDADDEGDFLNDPEPHESDKSLREPKIQSDNSNNRPTAVVVVQTDNTSKTQNEDADLKGQFIKFDEDSFGFDDNLKSAELVTLSTSATTESTTPSTTVTSTTTKTRTTTTAATTPTTTIEQVTTTSSSTTLPSTRTTKVTSKRVWWTPEVHTTKKPAFSWTPWRFAFSTGSSSRATTRWVWTPRTTTATSTKASTVKESTTTLATTTKQTSTEPTAKQTQQVTTEESTTVEPTSTIETTSISRKAHSKKLKITPESTITPTISTTTTSSTTEQVTTEASTTAEPTSTIETTSISRKAHSKKLKITPEPTITPTISTTTTSSTTEQVTTEASTTAEPTSTIETTSTSRKAHSKKLKTTTGSTITSTTSPTTTTSSTSTITEAAAKVISSAQLPIQSNPGLTGLMADSVINLLGGSTTKTPTEKREEVKVKKFQFNRDPSNGRSIRIGDIGSQQVVVESIKKFAKPHNITGLKTVNDDPNLPFLDGTYLSDPWMCRIKRDVVKSPVIMETCNGTLKEIVDLRVYKLVGIPTEECVTTPVFLGDRCTSLNGGKAKCAQRFVRYGLIAKDVDSDKKGHECFRFPTACLCQLIIGDTSPLPLEDVVGRL